MILAVLTKHCQLPLSGFDIYTATVGGAKLVEPSVDLAVLIATASAHTDRVIPSDLIAIGEVGLAGECRKVSGLAERLREASRIGFKQAIVPAGSEYPNGLGMSITEVHDVITALKAVDGAKRSNGTPPHLQVIRGSDRR